MERLGDKAIEVGQRRDSGWDDGSSPKVEDHSSQYHSDNYYQLVIKLRSVTYFAKVNVYDLFCSLTCHPEAFDNIWTHS